MRKYEEIPSVTKIFLSITCDVCGKEYSGKDWEEVQEFRHIGFTGGYGSIFGDGKQYTLDICQHCLNELLGKYLVPLTRPVDKNLAYYKNTEL